MRGFSRQLQAAVRMVAILSLALGLVYPLTVTALAQIGVRGPANGSLITHHGAVVGSSLLGQSFTGPQWFQSRPSASEYAGTTSGGTNLSPVSPVHQQTVEQRRRALTAANPQATGPVPDDALSASASGLDPDISQEYALWQVPRVAAARQLDPAVVRRLVDDHLTQRTLGFLGEPRVNVLQLNLALHTAR